MSPHSPYFWRLIPVLLLANSLTGHAQEADTLNICMNAAGHKILSSEACPSGYQTESHRIRPNVLNSDGLRAWAKRSKPLKVKSDRQREQEGRAALQAAEKQERRQRCENARRDYNFESTWKSDRQRSRISNKRAIMDKECRGL